MRREDTHPNRRPGRRDTPMQGVRRRVRDIRTRQGRVREAEVRRTRRRRLGRVIIRTMIKLAITFDRLRWEEKKLKAEAEKLGCETELIDARKLALDISKRELRNGFG